MLPFHALMELNLVCFILHYLIKNNFSLLTESQSGKYLFKTFHLFYITVISLIGWQAYCSITR